MSHITIQVDPVVRPALPFGCDMPSLRGSILLVEDETFVREVAAEILEMAGYQVLRTRSATEAIRVFREHKEIELLIVDVILPGKNGPSLAAELLQANPALKTIFISGYPENTVIRNSDLFRQAIYLPKPFSVTSLMQKIREAIVAA